MIENAKNTMMTSAPIEKAGFHFPGDGIYHNVVIWAENLEAATKEYIATRTLISPPATAATNTTATTATVEKDIDLQK